MLYLFAGKWLKCQKDRVDLQCSCFYNTEAEDESQILVIGSVAENVSAAKVVILESIKGNMLSLDADKSFVIARLLVLEDSRGFEA